MYFGPNAVAQGVLWSEYRMQRKLHQLGVVFQSFGALGTKTFPINGNNYLPCDLAPIREEAQPLKKGGVNFLEFQDISVMARVDRMTIFQKGGQRY